MLQSYPGNNLWNKVVVVPACRNEFDLNSNILFLNVLVYIWVFRLEMGELQTL